MTDFAEWLELELSKRNWRPADLASRARLDPGYVSYLLNRKRNIGPDGARAIAHALDLPEEDVFRRAGLLSPEPEDDEKPPTLRQWIAA